MSERASPQAPEMHVIPDALAAIFNTKGRREAYGAAERYCSTALFKADPMIAAIPLDMASARLAENEIPGLDLGGERFKQLFATAGIYYGEMMNQGRFRFDQIWAVRSLIGAIDFIENDIRPDDEPTIAELARARIDEMVQDASKFAGDLMRSDPIFDGPLWIYFLSNLLSSQERTDLIKYFQQETRTVSNRRFTHIAVDPLTYAFENTPKSNKKTRRKKQQTYVELMELLMRKLKPEVSRLASGEKSKPEEPSADEIEIDERLNFKIFAGDHHSDSVDELIEQVKRHAETTGASQIEPERAKVVHGIAQAWLADDEERHIKYAMGAIKEGGEAPRMVDLKDEATLPKDYLLMLLHKGDRLVAVIGENFRKENSAICVRPDISPYDWQTVFAMRKKSDAKAVPGVRFVPHSAGKNKDVHDSVVQKLLTLVEADENAFLEGNFDGDRGLYVPRKLMGGLATHATGISAPEV